MEYKPDFELAVPSGNRPDENKPSEVESLICLVKGQLYTLPSMAKYYFRNLVAM